MTQNKDKENPNEELEAEAADVAADAEGESSDQIKALEEEKVFLLEQLQRARAEFDNFRRRSNEERAVGRRRTTADVVRLVLPVYDDLQNAVGAEQSSTDLEKLKEGLELIANKFRDVLAQMEVASINEAGVPFDPSWHEAVFHQETDTVPAGHIVEIFECGYRLGDDLIRAARVMVAKEKPAATEDEGSADDSKGDD